MPVSAAGCSRVANGNGSFADSRRPVHVLIIDWSLWVTLANSYSTGCMYIHHPLLMEVIFDHSLGGDYGTKRQAGQGTCY